MFGSGSFIARPSFAPRRPSARECPFPKLWFLRSSRPPNGEMGVGKVGGGQLMVAPPCRERAALIARSRKSGARGAAGLATTPGSRAAEPGLGPLPS